MKPQDMDMNASLKKQIQEIVKIVQGVPDKFQEKCFEMLLTNALSEPAAALKKNDSSKTEQELPGKSDGANGGSLDSYRIPARVRTFMTRSSISEETIRGLIFVEGDQILFVQEPETTKIAKGQINWSLLLALKSAIAGNEFQVDPEEVRSVCIEKGLYDRANFNANFKNNKDLYNKTPAAQGGPIKLSQQGEKRLAELIGELMSRVKK